MIIPSDQVLSKSVEYYDPSRRVVYLERDFWQKYFSMLLRDFSNEMGVQPTPLMKRRLASSVKDVMYDYWHTKFVLGQDYGSTLWKEINRCFMAVANINRRASFSPVSPSVKQACREDMALELVREKEAEKPADGSEVVDALVNDYSQMEYDSLKEIEMEAIIEEASRCFYNEKESIEIVKKDHGSGRFRKYTVKDLRLSVIVDMVFAESSVYKESEKKSVGEVTLWNLIDLKEVLRNSKNILQDFTIARFNNFYKQYSSILVFSRLVQRIGYDVCELIYKGFMKNLNFSYVNVYEYAFCTIFLCDFCKRSIFSRSKYSYVEGFISLYLKGNTGLFGESYEKVVSPFSNNSSQDRAAIISASISLLNVSDNNSEDKKGSKRDSVFSSDGGNPFSNSRSTDFVFGQRY